MCPENGRTHSSMDRIMDSGSIDWGSTPHGCTLVCGQCYEIQLLSVNYMGKLSTKCQPKVLHIINYMDLSLSTKKSNSSLK